MDKLKNLKENIFGENNKHASDSIDFSVKPKRKLKKKINNYENKIYFYTNFDSSCS